MPEYDEIGPEMVVNIYHPDLNVHGFVVIDNTGLGPGKGGIRMTPFVTLEEVEKLARAMTWKTALAELPFGGAKSGIVCNPKTIEPEQKDAIVRAFAKALKGIAPEKYIAGPDMYMAEHEMGIIAEVLGPEACTGKPKKMGGLPHELGSTGFGIFHAAKVGAEHIDMDINGATIAIEGFGNVGTFAAKFLTEHGAKIIAVSDSKGCASSPSGLDYEKLIEIKKKTGSVTNYGGCSVMPGKDIIFADVDILIPAAIPNLIVASDVNNIKAKLIVEGSNIPMELHVERLLDKKGVHVVPDFVANAGGVISSYVEYRGGTEQEMFKLVENTIKKNTNMVLDHAEDIRKTPRKAALEIAKKRVLEKCEVCRKIYE